MSTFTNHTAQFWNERYDAPDFIYGEAPNAYLAAQRHRLRPGLRAFVPGDGEGRNGVWLAEQGLEVLSVDLSAAGVAKAQQLAEARGVPLRAEQADLTQWAWPTDQFDVVAAIYFHLPPEVRRSLHRAMLAALRPGGLLILAAYRPEQIDYQRQYHSGGPPNPAMMFTPAMLREDFAGAEVLDLEAVAVELQEGSHHRGKAAVVQGVFRRPEAGGFSVR